MVLSILHRITGIGMGLGLIVLAAWLVQAAAGPESYQYFRVTMSTPFGQILLIGWTLAFFLHLGNGIRHLVWDSGRGFDKAHSRATAWLVIILAVVLTAIVWVMR